MLTMITRERDLGFTTWTNSNDQFGRYPFNEYRIDLTEIINLSPNLLDSIISARESLSNVTLLNESDIFNDINNFIRKINAK
ncbi:MAG TPA: hypothetical protein VGB37_03480 [Candidatus Lokiarchaeia archaeon]